MYKKDFPYFTNSKTVYLDSGATTQKPQSVIDATVEYYTKYCSNTHRSGLEMLLMQQLSLKIQEKF